MSVTGPDWLTARGGELRLGPDRRTWFVLFAGTPQYKVVPIPAVGRFSCAVVQAVNGKRLDTGKETFGTADEAVRGGLDELRRSLGW
jgi:hypothetical protein